MATKTEFNLQSADIFYVCHVVGNALSRPTRFLRNHEDFMGDTAVERLLSPFPRFSPFLQYIEYIISSISEEDFHEDAELHYQPPGDYDDKMFTATLWIDKLRLTNGHTETFANKLLSRQVKDLWEYHDCLVESGEWEKVCENVSKQVFFVLFQHRSVLMRFAKLASGYVERAPELFPEKFTSRLKLKRAQPPAWAKLAVFHRDKGKCVSCRIDLTGLINTSNAICYDHIYPLSRGGINDVSNLQILCAACNEKKKARIWPAITVQEPWFDW